MTVCNACEPEARHHSCNGRWVDAIQDDKDDASKRSTGGNGGKSITKSDFFSNMRKVFASFLDWTFCGSMFPSTFFSSSLSSSSLSSSSSSSGTSWSLFNLIALVFFAGLMFLNFSWPRSNTANVSGGKGMGG